MKKVLLWGNSIFLAGLALALRSRAGVEVVCSAGDPLDAARCLGPDVVIVDLGDAHCGDALMLLRTLPALRLVGVNSATGAVSILSGQVQLAQTLEEVTRAIADF